MTPSEEPTASGPIDPELPSGARSPSPLGVALAGLGGFVGTLARYLVDLAWPEHDGGVPHTTILINTLGAFAIGIVATLLDRRDPPRLHLRALLVTGVLGGWTTMSALAVAVVRLDGHTGGADAVATVAVSITLGVAATALARACCGTRRPSRLGRHR
jgi:CrcB protein